MEDNKEGVFGRYLTLITGVLVLPPLRGSSAADKRVSSPLFNN
jgi:hypothetical protein